jgi:hypothetical protein
MQLLGEIKATKLIADLIEGRPGLRMSHNEPDHPAHRQRVQASIESLVRFIAACGHETDEGVCRMAPPWPRPARRHRDHSSGQVTMTIPGTS